MFAAIVAAIVMTADGLAEGLYAARHRFSARAASLGYVIGAGVAWFYNLVTPISFTVESVTVATKTAKSRPQISYIVVLSAVPSIVLGLFGLYSTFVDWLDPAVVAGVIAGVGVMLTGVSIGYLRDRPAVAVPATAAGLASYAATENLVVVIVASVVVGTGASYLVPAGLQRKLEPGDDETEDEAGEQNDDQNEGAEQDDQQDASVSLIPFQWREMVAPAVLIGAFSVFALRTGAVVSYDRVNSDLAGQDPELDGVTVMTGLGSLASGLLGGPPLESTPASTADTPQPVFATVLFLALMAVLVFFGLVGRLGRYIPLEAIVGFLIVLGIPVIMPENLPVVAEAPIAGGAALAVTALSNPFYGLLAGQAVILFWPG